MTTMQTRRPRPPVPVPIHDRADLLALQWSHGVEVQLRPADPDGCTDLADDVRAVVGEWLTRPTPRPGAMPLHTCRLWLRELHFGTERQWRGSARWQATVDADELLCTALADTSSGLVVVPLRKRQCA